MAAAAVAAVPRTGCTPPRARLTATLLEAARPPEAWLRCQTVGLTAPVKFQWKLGQAVKQVGYNLPRDEGALLVQLPDPPVGPSSRVECIATAPAGAPASATTTLAPINVTQVTVPAGGPITVEGSGFGPLRDAGDGVFLVPSRGAVVRADFACKQAMWTDAKIVACLPAGASGKWQVRVQSGARLGAYAPPVVLPPVGVAP